MFIFEKLKELLLSQVIIVSCIGSSKFIELIESVFDLILSRGAFDKVKDRVEVATCYVVCVLTLSCVQHLIFKAHQHQIKEL